MNEDLKTEICRRLLEGESLRAICMSEGMPSKSTVFLWLADDEDFAARYAVARVAQADGFADEIVAIADTPEIGVKTTTKPDGTVETVEGDMIEHRRLRVDARKWAASKLAPKKYGDAALLKLGDADGRKLDLPQTDMCVRLAAMAAALNARISDGE